MEGIIMESIVKVAGSFVLMLIGVLGTWLTLKVGKREELAAINTAKDEVIQAAELTVRELQQTIVEGLKAAHEDGKLTKDEIAMLGKKLLEETVKKMSAPAADLLAAAAVDVTALIQGAGESWIAELKKE